MTVFNDTTPVTAAGSYDIVVVGAGIAGIAAAVAAARLGRSVLLLEKSVLTGGLATLGLITYYEPLCDGLGRKIIGGLGEELLHLSIRYGFGTLEGWERGADTGSREKRYATLFSPALFVLALDELLEQEGVTLRMDSLFCKPVMEGSRCKGVITESKSGREFFAAGVVIDATGDLDVLAGAGAAYAAQNNFLSFFAAETDLDRLAEAVAAKDIRLATRYRMWGADRLGNGNPDGAGDYSGIGADAVTRFVLEGRKLARQSFADSRGSEQDLVLIPGMAQLRTTRRLEGMTLLRGEDAGRHFADSIGAVCDFSRAGPVYEIPYGALLSPDHTNILCAGRCISSEGHAWEVTRVIPAACLTGQAAGTAAALAVAADIPLQQLDCGTLQRRLTRDGVLIHG